MKSKIISAIIIVAIIIVGFALLFPIIFKDLPFIPDELSDSLAEADSSSISEVSINWN